MNKILICILLLIGGGVFFLSNNEKNITPQVPESDTIKSRGSFLEATTLDRDNKEHLQSKAYSYEFFYTDTQAVIKKEPTSINFQANKVIEPSFFTHQPTENIGTDLNNINEGLLPTEVLPGVEYIKEDDKVYFSGKNEGKYISVIPGQKPLLVRDLVKEVKDLNN